MSCRSDDKGGVVAVVVMMPFLNSQVSSSAALSIEDIAYNTRRRVTEEKLAKMYVFSWIYMGRKIFNSKTMQKGSKIDFSQHPLVRISMIDVCRVVGFGGIYMVGYHHPLTAFGPSSIVSSCKTPQWCEEALLHGCPSSSSS
jgi:hypothetical protein